MSDKKNHQDLLRDLITHIRENEIPFYRKEANAHYAGWHVFVALSILLSTAASLIAALVPAEQLKEPLIRGLLIALPILGTTVTAFMRSFSFHEREKNREVGLIEAERLLRKVESKFANANSEEEYQKAFLEATDDLAKLSHDQHVLDVATRKGIQIPAIGTSR
ncbi:MAG: hypothetical protein P4L87_20650 [Formivibrio sp.]|nr:hypothetical protein [Formivibrio sp.]